MSRVTAFLFMFVSVCGFAVALTLMSHPLENWFFLTLDIAGIAVAFFVLRRFSDPMDNQFYIREINMVRTGGTAATLSCGTVSPHISPKIRTFAAEIRFNRTRPGR